MRHRVQAPRGTVFTQQDIDDTLGKKRRPPASRTQTVVTGVKLINDGAAADLYIEIDYWPRSAQ